MSLEVERAKAKHNMRADSMEWLEKQQIFLETQAIGTDGTLFEHNTLEYGLTMGVVVETQEAIDALKELRMAEIFTPDQTELLDSLLEKLREELSDILIRLASVFVHAGMTPAMVIDKTATKMEATHEKYRRENFTGRTIAEGRQYSRDVHDGKSRLAFRSSILGEPVEPSSNPDREEPQEYEVYTAGAGAIN